jgi:4-amino-4-deoxy-L-arabinose transferase-like glycosyltransferase
VLLVALGVRLVAAVAPSRPLVSDEQEYDALASSLARSGTYSADGRPTAYRAPGYPIFVSCVYRVAGSDPLAVRLAQAVLDAGTAALIYAIAAPIQPVAALLAALLWALYPPAVLYARLLLPETLFGFALLLWTLLAVRAPPGRRGALLVLGAGVGILAWIKPTALFLLVTLPIASGIRGIKARGVLSLWLGASLVLAPWCVRNMRVLGTPAFVTSTGPVLLVGSNPASTGGIALNLPESARVIGPDEVAVDRVARAQAMRYIAGHPVSFVKTGLAKLALVFTLEAELPVLALHPNPADPSTSLRAKLRSIPLAVPAGLSLAYAILLLGGLAGLLAFPGGRLGAVTAAVGAAWLTVHFVFIGGTRYHEALMPLAAIYAGRLAGSPREAARALVGKRAVMLAAVAVGLVAVWGITIAILLRP